MSHKNLISVAIFSVIFTVVTAISHAGLWTVDRNIAGDHLTGFLLNDGTLIKAGNFGGGSSVTLGGVTFVAVTDNVSAAFSASSVYYNGTNNNLASLLNTQARTTSTTKPAEISFTGLIAGREYRMQMITGWPWSWLKYKLKGPQGETVNFNWKDGDSSPGINIATYVWTADSSNASFEFISTQSGSYKPADVHACCLYLLPEDVTPPGAPVNLAAVPGDRSVLLDFKSNTEIDFSSYNVYRSNISGGPYTIIASGLESSNYTDSDPFLVNEIAYYYVVAAVDQAGNTSNYSNEAKAIPSEYEIHSTKKGVGANNAARIHALGSSWYYGWNISRNYDVDPDIEYVPMRHNKWWPSLNNLATVSSPGFVPCRYILGYNEPDHEGSEKPTVQEALDFWPQIESAAAQYGLEIGSSACSNSNNFWQNEFMTKASDLGLQVDFMTFHCYPTPTNMNEILNNAQWYYNTYGKNVWLTEFNAADWSPPNDYTHEQSYTWMAETLYRLESTPYITRYAVFPWDASWDEQSQASHIFEEDTAVLTPLGKLYAEYRSVDIDGPYVKTWYHLHNRNSHRRLHNNGAEPTVADVYTEGDSVEFELSHAVDGYYYIDNKNTHARLQYNGSALKWVTFANKGSWVQWSLTGAGNGWKYITNRNFGKRLSSSGSSLTVENSSSTSNSVKWAFTRSGTDFINGDLNDDTKVDMDDLEELGAKWQNFYDMDDLLDIADAWLHGVSQ